MRGGQGWASKSFLALSLFLSPLAAQAAVSIWLANGAPLESDAAVIRAGFDLAVAPGVMLSIGYDGSFADRTQNNGLRVAIRWLN